ncbi:MAG: hypothetical protein IIC67_00360 [Thaumarchaeota archaeon]|nr:hypothetical protein [Nitrososphaerota archaeon]
MKTRLLIVLGIALLLPIQLVFAESLVPEPEQEPKQDIPMGTNCGPGTTYQDGICVVDKIENSTKISTDPSKRWGGLPARDVESPLKQFKSGITIDEIECKESLTLVTKHDGSPACVKEQTIPKLIERGWTSEGSVCIGGPGTKFDENCVRIKNQD